MKPSTEFAAYMAMAESFAASTGPRGYMFERGKAPSTITRAERKKRTKKRKAAMKARRKNG